MNRLPLLFLVFFLVTGLLSGCGSDEDGNQLIGVLTTLTPTPTLDPSGYQAVDPRACLVNEWNTLQSEQRRAGNIQWLQGSLLAWRSGSPSGQGELAYIAPNDRSSWFAGTLTLARGDKYAEHIILAPGVLVNGDLTWSPAGDWLAFLAFRPNEGVYTVMVVSADGTQLIDLFPTDLARTDNRTAQKAVIGWTSESVVQVIVSCGETCRQAFDFDVSAPPQPVLTPTPVSDHNLLKKYLLPDPRVVAITPVAYPKNMLVTPSPNLKYMGTTNWSPDDNLVAYLDRRGILWVLSIQEKINYILDIGLRDVFETQWSAASESLAVRAEDRVFIYEVPCRQPLP